MNAQNRTPKKYAQIYTGKIISGYFLCFCIFQKFLGVENFLIWPCRLLNFGGIIIK